MNYKNFYDISIWQMGAELLKNIYKLTTNLPIEERYALTTQIKKSANSIITNIAESHGRFFYKDKIRILYIARGEIEETRSHLLIASKLGYITSYQFDKLNDDYNYLSREINLYIMDLNSKC